MTNKEPAIIIPVFNEEKTIGNLLKNIKNKGSVFVIDDNSTDNSHNIISKYEVNLIKNRSNIGYSKTIQRGIKIVKTNGYKYAITFDSDGEHNIEDIEKITLLLKNNYALVVGSRNKKNRNIEILASILTNFFIGIKDPFCGLKGYDLSKITLQNPYLQLEMEDINTYLMIFYIKKNLSFSNFNINVKKSSKRKNSRFGDGFFSEVKLAKSFFYWL